jgi:hypothetical protein
MKKEALVEMEEKVMELVVERRRLGGFDANAGSILKVVEYLLEIVRHLKEKEKGPHLR